jgi:hypothetical protein
MREIREGENWLRERERERERERVCYIAWRIE